MKKAIFLFSVLSLLALVGCKSKVSGDFWVMKGDQFTIDLKSNPSTGYSWQCINQELLKCVELEKHEFIAVDTDLVGAPKIEKWTFDADQIGIDTLIFKYRRPWENDQPAQQTRKFIVVVE